MKHLDDTSRSAAPRGEGLDAAREAPDAFADAVLEVGRHGK
jgi:hypothetical protein